MDFDRTRCFRPAQTRGAPTQQDAQHTGASISLGLSLNKLEHHLHPEPRSLHSHKAVYARSRDASVKTPANALVASEDLRGVLMIANNMFLVFKPVGLSQVGRTLSIAKKGVLLFEANQGVSAVVCSVDWRTKSMCFIFAFDHVPSIWSVTAMMRDWINLMGRE